jgi:hypothetical protein
VNLGTPPQTRKIYVFLPCPSSDKKGYFKTATLSAILFVET